MAFSWEQEQISHQSTLNRRRRNNIFSIRSVDSSWITKNSEIKRIFIEYFKNLFCSKDSFKFVKLVTSSSKVSQMANTILTTIPTKLEIFNVIKFMKNYKSPGPDGFPIEFYTLGWLIIKEEIVLTIANFFKDKKLPNKLNHAYIALIPKKDVYESPTDFRPISLCNVLYKIIATILANRLSPYLNSIISDEQGAFVKGC